MWIYIIMPNKTRKHGRKASLKKHHKASQKKRALTKKRANKKKSKVHRVVKTKKHVKRGGKKQSRRLRHSGGAPTSQSSGSSSSLASELTGLQHEVHSDSTYIKNKEAAEAYKKSFKGMASTEMVSIAVGAGTQVGQVVAAMIAKKGWAACLNTGSIAGGACKGLKNFLSGLKDKAKSTYEGLKEKYGKKNVEDIENSEESGEDIQQEASNEDNSAKESSNSAESSAESEGNLSAEDGGAGEDGQSVLGEEEGGSNAGGEAGDAGEAAETGAEDVGEEVVDGIGEAAAESVI